MDNNIELIKNHLESNGDTIISDIEMLSGAYMMVVNNKAGDRYTIIVTVKSDGTVEELMSTVTDDTVGLLVHYIQAFCKFNEGGNF